jgi:hypothetical protein
MASLHLGWVDAFLESSNCAGRQEISARWALNFHIEDPGRGLTVLKHSWYANNLRELQRLKPVLARYFYVARERATHNASRGPERIAHTALRSVVCRLERKLSRGGIRRVEKRGEGVGLAAIDESGYQKLVFETFGMAGAAQESEETAHFRLRMNYDAVIALDGRDDQSAKGAAIAQRGGIDGVEQFHAQERSLGKHIEDISRGRFHAGLQLKTDDAAGWYPQRDNTNGRGGRESL